VLPDEVGKPLTQLASGGLGLRIYRGDAVIGYWDEGAKKLEDGDQVVEVVHTEPAAA
jgi:voltage-gated potassium channel